MSSDDDLRRREAELSELLERQRAEISTLRSELTLLSPSLERLRADLEQRARHAAAAPVPSSPGARLLKSILLGPLAIVGGVLSGLLTWSFVGVPSLVLDVDPAIPLTALPVLLVSFGLIGLGYALARIWG